MTDRGYKFGPFTFDRTRRLLFRNGVPLPLGQKSLIILEALILGQGHVVPKATLMDAAWNGDAVEESNLSVQVAALRKVLGQSRPGVEWIATVQRVGYQFVNPEEKPVTQTTTEPSSIVAEFVAGRPSIAVLAFVNMSSDPEQEYFSDGISEDIITNLAKVSGLRVVGRHNAFTYKGSARRLTEIAAELGVRYLLGGSVRMAQPRARITAELTDGKDGEQIWAERYDRDLTDIFEVQDEIARAIVDQLKVRLLPEEKQALEMWPTHSTDAYDYYLQGRHFWNLHSIANVLIAERLFRKALDLDPDFARAHAGLSLCAWFQEEGRHSSVTVQYMMETSSKAIALDPALAEAHTAHGCALAYSNRWLEGLAAFQRAMALDPNLYEAPFLCGMCAYFCGDRETAATMWARAATVAPDDYGPPLMLAQVYRDLGRMQDSIEVARIGIDRAERALARHPDIALPASMGASQLAQLGEREQALEWAARALMISPDEPFVQYNVACAYALLGESDRALDLLERYCTDAEPEANSKTLKDSDFDGLRDHPRFQKLFA